MAAPEELARQLQQLAKPCTELESSGQLLQCLRQAQTYSSPASVEPIRVFANAGGVRALGTAMKVNTPLCSEWADDQRPAIDLAEVHKEACGFLNNLAAAALAGHDDIVSELRAADIIPVLVSSVDAYVKQPEVLHRALPALAQMSSLMADQLEASEAAVVVVRCMTTADANDVWIQCSGARVLNSQLSRGPAAKQALLHAGGLQAAVRALDAAPDQAKAPRGFSFDSAQLRTKLVAMGAPLLQQLGALASELYPPGKKGVLRNLSGRADLNGGAAEVVKPTSEEAASLRVKGRVKVRTATNETLSVQFKNLWVDGLAEVHVS